MDWVQDQRAQDAENPIIEGKSAESGGHPGRGHGNSWILQGKFGSSVSTLQTAEKDADKKTQVAAKSKR